LAAANAELTLLAHTRTVINNPNVDAGAKAAAESELTLLARARTDLNSPTMDEGAKGYVESVLEQLAAGRISVITAEADIAAAEAALDSLTGPRTVQIYAAIQSVGGSTGGPANVGTLVGETHAGSVVGRFHTGRIPMGFGSEIRNDEILAILKQGERIFSPGDTKELDQTVQSINNGNSGAVTGNAGKNTGNTYILNLSGLISEPINEETLIKLFKRMEQMQGAAYQ
jgi:hypothetical protein